MLLRFWVAFDEAGCFWLGKREETIRRKGRLVVTWGGARDLPGLPFGFAEWA
jgi:hypothetical protein